jgi:hypothetical protein
MADLIHYITIQIHTEEVYCIANISKNYYGSEAVLPCHPAVPKVILSL